jgi:hypothetical protein
MRDLLWSNATSKTMVANKDGKNEDCVFCIMYYVYLPYSMCVGRSCKSINSK